MIEKSEYASKYVFRERGVTPLGDSIWSHASLVRSPLSWFDLLFLGFNLPCRHSSARSPPSVRNWSPGSLGPDPLALTWIRSVQSVVALISSLSLRINLLAPSLASICSLWYQFDLVGWWWLRSLPSVSKLISLFPLYANLLIVTLIQFGRSVVASMSFLRRGVDLLATSWPWFDYFYILVGISSNWFWFGYFWMLAVEYHFLYACYFWMLLLLPAASGGGDNNCKQSR